MPGTGTSLQGPGGRDVRGLPRKPPRTGCPGAERARWDVGGSEEGKATETRGGPGLAEELGLYL